MRRIAANRFLPATTPRKGLDLLERHVSDGIVVGKLAGRRIPVNPEGGARIVAPEMA
jgi:hypothetical protein